MQLEYAFQGASQFLSLEKTARKLPTRSVMKCIVFLVEITSFFDSGIFVVVDHVNVIMVWHASRSFLS
jgi:nitrogen fixation protein FixH